MPVADSRAAHGDDRRSRRTRQMLTAALLELMREQRYDTITVQAIIDRANIGRSTFYAHYRDKEDLLQSAIARYVATLGSHMDAGAAGHRLIPSLELLRHLQENYAPYRALVRGRASGPLLQTMQAHLSGQVEARLARGLLPGTVPTVPLPVLAQHVAGALLTLLQWWVDREMPESPEQIDGYFRQLVRPSVQAATGIDI